MRMLLFCFPFYICEGMKKLLTSLLLLVYLLVSAGFVVSVHYCMDKVRSLQLGNITHKNCMKCGMPIKEGKGCCKDEVKVMKMQIDQSPVKWAQADFSLSPVAVLASSFLSVPLFGNLKKTAPFAHGPPLSKQDTYLLNCVFRI